MEEEHETWLRDNMPHHLLAQLTANSEYNIKMRDNIITAHRRVIESLGNAASEAIKAMLDEAESRNYSPPANNAVLSLLEYIKATALASEQHVIRRYYPSVNKKESTCRYSSTG